MSRRLRLMGDRILIRMDEESEKMASGLYKPDGAHESILQTGVVVDVGPGKWDEGGKRTPVGVEPGDGVLFVKFLAQATKTAESLQHHLNKDEALLVPKDILLVYDRDNPPEFT